MTTAIRRELQAIRQQVDSLRAARPTTDTTPEELRRRETARSGVLDFTLFTKTDYIINWHHRVICQYLDRFFAGKIRRLMIFTPPRHGKSELVSRRFPAYVLGRNPDANLIACSHTADLASDMNRDVQRIIDSD